MAEAAKANHGDFRMATVHRVVVHSRRPEIAHAARLGEAAISRLDGSSWLRFAREDW